MAAFVLGPAARQAGYGVLGFDTVGSTSREARDRALVSASMPLWVAARQQTAGYGRRGRQWQSPAGNLAVSLLTAVAEPAGRAATLGFVAGLALIAAIDEAAPALGRRMTLKWPNDVLVDGAKLAGILVEIEEMGQGGRAAVVGVGVNVAAAPEGLPYAATSLAALGVAVTPETLFTAFAEAWVTPARIWAEGGFAALRVEWLARAAGLGGATTLRHGDRILHGVFETVDDDGRLVLDASDGVRHAIAAGEVYFGAVATATAG